MFKNVLIQKFVLRLSILLSIIIVLIATLESLSSQMYTLDFPNKKNKWFTLRNQNNIVAELGTKNFDFYTNVEKEKYLSFIVFSQGGLCKSIYIEQTQVDYIKFKQMPFLDQSLEIPTLNKDPKSFCSGMSNSHFKLKNLNNVKTVKKSFKKFNTDKEIEEFLKTFPKNKKEDLQKEMISVDVLEMNLHKI